MTDPIYPPLPLNIPGNIVPATARAGTGLSYFVPPTAIPGETPPNTQVLPFEGIVTQNLVPGLVPVVFVPQQGPPPVVPTVPVTAGLVSWYRADMGVSPGTGSGGTGAAAWNDSSGHGHDLAQAVPGNQPTINAVDPAYNGKTTLSFTSAGASFMQTSAWTTPLVQPATVIFVGQSTQDAVRLLFDGIEAINRIDMYVTSAPDLNVSSNGGGNLITIAGTTTSPDVLAGIYNGVASTAFKNAKTGVAGNTGPQGLVGLTLGGSFVGGNNMNGKIAEFIVYNRILLPAEISQVFDYLGTRYGIVIGP
jgi:hypothetical protein